MYIFFVVAVVAVVVAVLCLLNKKIKLALCSALSSGAEMRFIPFFLAPLICYYKCLLLSLCVCVCMWECVWVCVPAAVFFHLRRSECETEIIMKEEEDRRRIKKKLKKFRFRR